MTSHKNADLIQTAAEAGNRLQHLALIYIYICTLVAAWRSNGLALSLARRANGIYDGRAVDGFAQKQ